VTHRRVDKGTARRWRPEERHRDIVDKAADFFASRGFDGATRELARHIGITQPLLYRYFPTKESLIREVYQAVFIDVWRPTWDELLVDRSVTLGARLERFFNEYTDDIMNARWMRIYFFSALRDAEINKLYLRFIEERILRRIIIESIRESQQAPREITPLDMESGWILLGGIFHYGVRLHIYQHRPSVTKIEMIRNAVRVFLTGFSGGAEEEDLAGRTAAQAGIRSGR
jgi:AcrR family transcriptional regulator